MIKINITYDFIVKVEQIKNLKRGVPGIYIFLDIENKPLYVGIARDLRTRVEQHLLKRTNTKRFAHHFKKVALIYEKDILLRKITETYLIHTLDTPINKNGRHPVGLEGKRVSTTPEFNQCKGLTNEGKRCIKLGHTNGFCHYHGGNGESISALKEQQDKDWKKTYQ